jgi:uncharacterized protein
MRLLIMIAGFIVLVLLFRSLLPRPRTRPRQDNTPEKMVSCLWCRLYLPESEALQGNGKFFCNREHHNAWLEDQRQKKD